MKSQTLTIGKLAKAANVNIETIRHYQRQGLITEPEKPESGFRHYSSDIINRIEFIKRAQQLGFSLKDIQQLLLLGSDKCADVKQLADEKRESIQQQIDNLTAIKAALDELIVSCQHNQPQGQCRFIDTLCQKSLYQ